MNPETKKLFRSQFNELYELREKMKTPEEKLTLAYQTGKFAEKLYEALARDGISPGAMIIMGKKGEKFKIVHLSREAHSKLGLDHPTCVLSGFLS